ncbi:low temperature requirement protein A [Streptomyces sp. NPDC050504]|uniref:low temperature requirement protein A n=1 Tax=Streptomyces sp. NPDC050504 TaxID=3365618 RepID=UPI00378DBD91
MAPRSRTEAHRAATPLELFFDLCFVVAVAQAGARLVHDVAEGHFGHGLAAYLAVFAAVWWAWMNFTWFASAYDCDDVPYRVMTLVQITGVLIFAAGIPRAFDNGDWTVGVIGYAVMRLALAGQWLRAALSTGGADRRVALRYAAGVAVCQVGWVAMLLVPDSARNWAFVALFLCELSVPALAERDHQTPWHPHHIAERYGLFTIIVLGETIAAATVAVQEALNEHDELWRLVPIAGGGLLIVFAAYWIYFAVPIHDHLRSNRQAFLWGYGHVLVFGSAAAIGAGIEIAVEQTDGKAHISTTAASAAVTIPAALFLLAVWALHSRHFKRTAAQQLTLPVAAALVLASTFAGHWAVLVAGLVAAATVAVGVTLAARAPRT